MVGGGVLKIKNKNKKTRKSGVTEVLKLKGCESESGYDE